MENTISSSMKVLSMENNHIKSHNGLKWERKFGSGDPYFDINWEYRTAKIVKPGGEVVFQQENVEIPDFWSQTATDIVTSKYFRGRLDSEERENSVKQMIDRVADTISIWGYKDGYFISEEDCFNFRDDLKWLLVHQFASFNSPVWFNVGIYERPQCSACFILSVEDNMASILEWGRSEGWIFKGGSGSGINLSTLRSSKESLSKGGHSSGPVSFMKLSDGIANSIKSGGTTRRAAKMVILNADHPDLYDFIYCKKYIEDMTKILEKSGIKDSIEANLFDPYTLLPYQNANNSVRVTDDFMEAVRQDKDWYFKAVTNGEIIGTVKAREVLHWCADAAWHSADPGMQYDTTINKWHTCPNTGRINASNPCAEYMHLDDSACNLASLNLLKFTSKSGFNVERFKDAVDTFITAQEILVSNSSYPTEKIDRNAKDFRELGLGYANLGSLLMVNGLPYNSEGGRNYAAAITSIMCGEAYKMSALIGQKMGPFAGYEINREPMLKVMRMHKNEAIKLSDSASMAEMTPDLQSLAKEGAKIWNDAVELGEKYGYRNSQATVLAPTGTIAFMMDCDSTGVEPALALVSYKKLVGGGTLKLVNRQLKRALEVLGYSETEIEAIEKYTLEKETIEGAPSLKSEHLAVFDCSFKPIQGERSISYEGHLKMMGAVQPFISGAISKTVNLPNEATVDDIEKAFVEAWKLGIKAVAFYRDGSKSIQPLNLSKDDKLVESFNGYTRLKLPDERPSITHKFSVQGYEGYITVGLYPETQKPGETFLVAAKEGSTISGLFDTIATLTSMCLQSGVPLKVLVKKFKDVRFEPAGFTNNPEIPMAKSIIDYIFRYLGLRYLNKKDREDIFGPSEADGEEVKPSVTDLGRNDLAEIRYSGLSNEENLAEKRSSGLRQNSKGVFSVILAQINPDSPACSKCGTLMNKMGSCYSCPNCFNTTGACN